MNACDFAVFEKFDLAACLHSIAFGWVPDWIWALLPYWPWIVVIGGAGMAYKFAGWPGVAVFFGGAGFIAGRKSVEPADDFRGDVAGPDAEPPPAPRKRRKTIFDVLKR